MTRHKSHLAGSGCLHLTESPFRSSISINQIRYKPSLYSRIPQSVCIDDNREILDLLIERMELGRNRYGQGIRREDDTRKFGCEDDSWLEMELQEILDGMIYTATSILRLRDKTRARNLKI